MPYTRIALDTEARRRLADLLLADDGATPAPVPADEHTADLIAARYLDAADAEAAGQIPVLIRDEAARWARHYLERGDWRHADRADEHEVWHALLERQRTVMEVWSRPSRDILAAGAEYGRHHLGDALETMIRQDVEEFYRPGLREWRRGEDRPGCDIGDEDLQRLLDRAPRPALLGVDDWGRRTRADEDAVIWGIKPPQRRPWLERADVIAAAWGLPLFGPGTWTGHPIEEFLTT